jgi:hypothetical protein
MIADLPVVRRHFHLLKQVPMSYPPALSLALALSLLAQGIEAQQIDPALRGSWTLNVARSTFGPDGSPSGGTVRWTEHGWVLALVFPNGYVYADAVFTDHGCALIGVPADYTCRLAVITPKHVRFTLRQAAAVRRVGDIESVDSNTTRATHHVSPASGAPYTETTIWLRDQK